jgi:hypothetical protein
MISGVFDDPRQVIAHLTALFGTIVVLRNVGKETEKVASPTLTLCAPQTR